MGDDSRARFFEDTVCDGEADNTSECSGINTDGGCKICKCGLSVYGYFVGEIETRN